MYILIKIKDTDNIIGVKEDIAMRLEGIADIERIDVREEVHMPKHINIETAINTINKAFGIPALGVAQALTQTPSDDVVDIIRCSECAYSNHDGSIYDGTTCRYGVGHSTKPNGFCHNAERWEEE